MGYATVMNVPRVRTYAQAKSLFDSIKPLRGRAVEIRPLGNRRDADQYWVRMNGDEVEFILYKTPVMTYKPDGDIEITTDGWNTTSTHQFIARVLNVNCYGSRNKSILEVNSCKHVISDKLTLRLENGNWCISGNAQDLYDWRIDRKVANNVRGRYSEFYKYLKGFVNLRTHEITEKFHWNEIQYQGISFSMKEAVDLIGTVQHSKEKGWWLVGGLSTGGRETDILRKPSPVKYSIAVEYDKAFEEYKGCVNAFLNLVKGGQGDDAYQNFYKASMLLMLYGTRDALHGVGGGFAYQKSEENKVWNIKSNTILPLLDTILFKWHSDEVLVWQKLPKGRLPTDKYVTWVNKQGVSK